MRNKKTRLFALLLCLCMIFAPMLAFTAYANPMIAAWNLQEAMTKLYYQFYGIDQMDSNVAFMTALGELCEAGRDAQTGALLGTSLFGRTMIQKFLGMNDAFDDVAQHLVTLPDGTQVLRFDTTYGSLKDGAKTLQELIGYAYGSPVSGSAVLPQLSHDSIYASKENYRVSDYITFLDSDQRTTVPPKVMPYDTKAAPMVYTNFSPATGVTHRSYRILYDQMTSTGYLKYKVFCTTYKTDGTSITKETSFARSKNEEVLGVGFYTCEADQIESYPGIFWGMAYRKYIESTASYEYSFFSAGIGKPAESDIPIDNLGFSFNPPGQVSDVINGYNKDIAGKSISYDFSQWQRVLDYLDSQATAESDVISLDVPLVDTDAGLVIDDAYIKNLYRLLSRDLVADMVAAGVITGEEAGTVEGEAEADLTLWGIPELIFLFVKILIECIKLLSRCFIFIGTLYGLEPNASVFPSSFITGYNAVRDFVIPGFGVTLFDLVQTVVMTLLGFGIVKAIRRRYGR